MYLSFLIFHIGAAVITVGLIGYALACMVRSKTSVYRTIAFSITSVAAFEVATGVVLIARSPELSATKVGAHIALYLGVCLTVNIALYLRAQTPAWIS